MIPWNGGHLCLVHEAVELDDDSRAYTHRWVWFGADWHLAELSPPFVFQERGVEFAAGLAQRGDDLIISYGRWDRDQAFLAVVPIAEMRALLAPPLVADEIERQLRGDQPAGTMRASTSRPSIVSTTLSGNGQEIIGDALRSVVEW